MLASSTSCGSASDTAQIPTTRSCTGRSPPIGWTPAGSSASRCSRTSRRSTSGRARGGSRSRRSRSRRTRSCRTTTRSSRTARASAPATGRSSSRGRPLPQAELSGLEIVVPGTLTSSFLALRLVLGDFAYRELAFEAIPEEVASGRADAGLLIHEGQLTFESFGLAKVLDLGEWWLLETGLPLPLGVNAARRDLGLEVLHDVSEVLSEAIQCSLDNRAEALEYAVQFGRGIDAAVADRFVAMYVNELTQDYGQEGRKAVTEFLRRGEAMGAFPAPVQLDFIDYRRWSHSAVASRAPTVDHSDPHASWRPTEHGVRSEMRKAVVISGVRTPIGRYGGALSHVRPDDLAALVVSAAVERAGVEPSEIDDVYFGAPTRRVRTTGTSRAWPCCLPGSRNPSPR